MIPTIRFYSIAHQKLSQYRNGIHDLLLPVPLQVTDMAKHLLEKQPEVLFGGDSLASGEKGAKTFGKKFVRISQLMWCISTMRKSSPKLYPSVSMAIRVEL